MRCTFKETDMWDGGFHTWYGLRLAGEKTHPGNIRQTGWFGEVDI